MTVAEIEFKLQYNPFSVHDIQVSAAKALQAQEQVVFMGADVSQI